MTEQYRTIVDGECRTVGDESTREIEAKIVSYDVGPDTYKTTWARGVFGDSLREAMPPVCWMHDERQVIGSVRSFEDRDDGLYVRMQLADFDDVPQARAAYSLIRDGHVNGWSFRFGNPQAGPDPKHRGAVQFTKARLRHVSPVVAASVPLTRTVAVRSEEGEALAATEEDLALTLGDALASALSKQDGVRSVTVDIDEQGAVTVGGTRTEEPADVETPTEVVTEPPASGLSADCRTIAVAVDEALAAAVRAVGDGDPAEWPEPLRTAWSYVRMAEAAAADLLEMGGVLDEEPTVERTEVVEDDGPTAAELEQAVTEAGEPGEPAEPSARSEDAEPLPSEAELAMTRARLAEIAGAR